MSETPLGVIAGNGSLPLRIVEAQRAAGRAVFVVALQDEAAVISDTTLPIGHLKAIADALIAAKCREMVIIGGIQRPKLEALDFDEGGEWFLEKVMADTHNTGDDKLLKYVVAYFESRGLEVHPAERYLDALTAAAGSQTTHQHTAHQRDIECAIEVARVIGVQDIGQSVVVANGLVLAVEGPEGTDAMLERVQALPSDLRGTADEKRGVLAKLPKPQQDRRVDLPTLGCRTIELAAAAHLAGVVYEAGGALFDDFEAVTALAESAGIFLLGLEPTH